MPGARSARELAVHVYQSGPDLIIGSLDDEQRARLLEIANRCPVHRTLSAGVIVQTELADAGRVGSPA